MELCPVTRQNLPLLLHLHVLPEQQRFVASNAESMEDARLAREQGEGAVPMALCQEYSPVGFAMLRLGPGDDTCCLWRLMIDARFQGHGLGAQAMEEILALIRRMPRILRCRLSYEADNTAARALYRRFGFRETGESEDGETVAELIL